MFCGKCGMQNPDENAFCAGCGAPLRQGVATVPHHAVAAVPYHAAAPAVDSYTVEQTWSERVQRVLIGYFKSPIFLVTVICYTLIQLIHLVGEQDGLSGTMGVALSGAEAGSFLELLSGVKLLVALPGVLVCVGLWMTCYSAYNPTNGKINAGGLTLVRVVQIVVASLLMVMMVLSLLSVISLSSQIDSDAASSAFGTIIFVLFLSLVLTGVYYGLVLSSLSKVIDTIRTGVMDSSVSMTLAVFQFISGGCSLLGMMTANALLETGIEGVDLGSLLGISGEITLIGLLNCGMPIIWGVGICMYRSTIDRLQGEAYEFRKAGNHPSAAGTKKNVDLPAWKRVQIEQGLDD